MLVNARKKIRICNVNYENRDVLPKAVSWWYLESEATPLGDNGGAEAHEVTVDEGAGVTVLVGSAEVDSVRPDRKVTLRQVRQDSVHKTNTQVYYGATQHIAVSLHAQSCKCIKLPFSLQELSSFCCVLFRQ